MTEVLTAARQLLRASGCDIATGADHAPTKGRYRYVITPPGVYRDRILARAREISVDSFGLGCEVDGDRVIVRSSWSRGAAGVLRDLYDATEQPAPAGEPPIIVHGRVEGHYLFEAIGYSRAEVEQALLSAYARHVGAMPEGQAEVDWLREIIADDGVSWTELRPGQAAIDGEVVA